MKQFLLMFFFILVVIQLYSQTERFSVEIVVVDTSYASIKDVALYDELNNLKGVTNSNGIANATVSVGEILLFTHIDYERKTVCIDKKDIVVKDDGRFTILIELCPKVYVLQDVVIQEIVPQLAYENKSVWTSDYVVKKEGLYLLIDDYAYHSLLFLDHNQDTISQFKIKPKFDELYEDVFGNIHLLGSDSAYQVCKEEETLRLDYGVSIETFRQKLEPVKILTDSIMVLQKYANMQQQLVYLMVNRNNKQISILADLNGTVSEMARNAKRDAIRDKKMDMMQAEFQENPQSEKRFEKVDALSMQNMEMNFNSDENDIEERKRMMNSLFNRILFKPIYCPALYIRDSIYVFDFQNDKMFKYDNRGYQTNSCEIDFHRTGYFKNLLINNPWDEKLIVDDATNQCYAQFSSDGIVTLKEINLDNGKVKREILLTDHSFPQNIQVYDGYVYYLYLDKTRVVNKDKRSLYKMKL